MQNWSILRDFLIEKVSYFFSKDTIFLGLREYDRKKLVPFEFCIIQLIQPWWLSGLLRRLQTQVKVHLEVLNLIPLNPYSKKGKAFDSFDIKRSLHQWIQRIQHLTILLNPKLDQDQLTVAVSGVVCSKSCVQCTMINN